MTETLATVWRVFLPETQPTRIPKARRTHIFAFHYDATSNAISLLCHRRHGNAIAIPGGEADEPGVGPRSTAAQLLQRSTKIYLPPERLTLCQTIQEGQPGTLINDYTAHASAGETTTLRHTDHSRYTTTEWLPLSRLLQERHVPEQICERAASALHTALSQHLMIRRDAPDADHLRLRAAADAFQDALRTTRDTPEQPPEKVRQPEPQPPEPDSAEATVIRQELHRRQTLLSILQAQAAVLHGEYLESVQTAIDSGPDTILAFTSEIHAKCDDLEAKIAPETRDAMIASIQAAATSLPAHSTRQHRSDQMARAADNALDYARTKNAIEKESAIVRALQLDRAPIRNKLSHQAKAYYDALDQSPHLQHAPPQAGDAPCIYMRVPRSALEPDATEDAKDAPTTFFDGSMLAATEEDGATYTSMKATLTLEDTDGTASPTLSIVDSGAAQCAIRLSTLTNKLPHLAAMLRPSTKRFVDASGNRMSLVGSVPLSLMIADRRITTDAYVFRDLGAEFLLGTNALLNNGLVIDGAHRRLYVSGDPLGGVPLIATMCEHCPTCRASPTTPADTTTRVVCDHTGCHEVHITCNRDQCCLVLRDGHHETTLPCSYATKESKARLVLQHAVHLAPGEHRVLPARLHAAADRLAPIAMEMPPTLADRLTADGAQIHQECTVNPTCNEAPFLLTGGKCAITLPKGTVLMRESTRPEEDTVMVAAVLEQEKPPPPLNEGGREWLHDREFNLEKAIDPDERRADGSYAPLSDAKKDVLYELALKWYSIWALDAKVPKISHLVVLSIPTGDAAPITQPPYPIPAKLRDEAMKEVEKLLKAGLIEPSMSEWAAPVLVRLKKDSTPENVKLKLIIDFSRCNSVTVPDAGGLGTQSDILYGVGGRYKFIGLADAAAGFYQYLLDPRTRDRSAFILPASMGGTLFQWVVAPYGLTRNPAGYSRGMQWVLKGLHSRRDLDHGKARGGATSWLDDICMKADTFPGFCDLVDRVFGRLAAANMSLKGSKCELLHEFTDILGFVATPHGIMLQKPKLAAIMEQAAPTTVKEARTFLGGVAFLRRMVPRISLLTAPITAVIKQAEKRYAAKTEPRTRATLDAHARRKREDCALNEQEINEVEQAWTAVLDHLDASTALSSPDFDDPNAAFVLCTDASDFAVGGVLMQWQHAQCLGPGPPAHLTAVKGEDPLDSAWRAAAGWKLKIIGYYSKTLDPAQQSYPTFDKEAGAIVLCMRHWSDIVTYQRITVYTDSAVATSMLTKHNAPPRLQRWGAELSAFLPHLRIAYRKGCDNGLADLLSRFPVYKKFVKTRQNTVSLPDDLFEFVGEAPLYHRHPSIRGPAYLKGATYELYEPRRPAAVVPDFWTSDDTTLLPELTGRGGASRPPNHPLGPSPALTEFDEMNALLSADARDPFAPITRHPPKPFEDDHFTDRLTKLASIFPATFDRTPTLHCHAPPTEATTIIETATAAGLTASEPDEADIHLRLDPLHGPPASPAWLRKGPPRILLNLEHDEHSCTVHFNGQDYACHTSFHCHIPHVLQSTHGHPQCTALHAVLLRAVTAALERRFRVPLTVACPAHLALAQDRWIAHGLLPDRASPRQPPPPTALIATAEGEADGDGDAPAPPNAPRAYPWEQPSPGDPPEPELNTTMPPTVHITLEMQEQDPELKLLVDALNGHRTAQRSLRTARARVADRYTLRDDGLFRLVLRDGEPAAALVVPRQARAALLARYHYSPADGGGHTGAQRLYDTIRQDYFWKGMERECHAFVGACAHCGATRSQASLEVSLGAAPTPTAPFEVIHIDHKGPLPMSNGYTYVLVVVCALTKFTLYIPVTAASGPTTLTALTDHVFSIFGYPLVIISDNGSAFANKLMKASERLYGFRHIFVLPHTPQANGLAEAAVQKLKLIFDRHTYEYRDWHPIVGMCQAAVNRRISKTTQLSPFAALFGRAAVTLTALEHPHLLPVGSRDEQSVSNLGFLLSRLHARLRQEGDDLKEMAARSDQLNTRTRALIPGDRVWLNYSDSERARYLRKHGHGLAWRHAYRVLEVKPHGVRLEVPHDGSVPDVLPWQSLRKCALSAPRFHDSDMPRPEVSPQGYPMAPEPDEEPPSDEHASDQAEIPVAEGDDGYASWTASREYEIERIVSAEHIGRGWRLSVKWLGYPDPTPEPLFKILAQTQHPDLLRQIEECKTAFYERNPAARARADAHADPVAPALRQLPARDRRQANHFVFAITECTQSAVQSARLHRAWTHLRRDTAQRSAQLCALLPDQPCVLIHPNRRSCRHL